MDETKLDREIDELYAAITGRRFSYDPGSDPLYRSYADRYIQNGRLAMRDTVGQAAALTGGYSSSYAQGVGQQQYDAYLRALSEALPELYSLAHQQYTAQGDALQNAYDMTVQRRESEYQRQRDAAADAAAQERQEYERMQTAYKNLYQLISTTGYEPTDEELAAAGLSREQAEALRQEYKRKNKSSQSVVYYGSGSGKSGSSEKDKPSGSSGSSGGGYILLSNRNKGIGPLMCAL